MKLNILFVLCLLLANVWANTDATSAETHNYQAEVSSLMKLIIHSLYTNRDIFIRELLANSSDALDKLRLKSLEDRSVMKADPEMRIRVVIDRPSSQIIVEDSGIGMTKTELVELLGTIAKSGTKQFMKKLEDATKSGDGSSLIGQFGVGFYASFLVADKVQVVSRAAVGDGKQWKWESEADSTSFTISEDTDGSELKRGTRIILHVKKDAEDFLNVEKLEELIRKYAQFHQFPVYLYKERTVEVEEESKDDGAADGKEDGERKDGDDEKERKDKGEKDDEKTEKERKKVEKSVQEDVLMNPNKPVWMRKPDEVTKDEYNQFYKAYFSDHSDPLLKVHFKGDGDVQFRALFFVPKRPPFSPFTSKTDKEEAKSVALYVRRVFITRSQIFSEAISSFVVGIIDSDDLPLNVSRELLQNSSLMGQIKRKSTNKVLDALSELKASDAKAFDDFYRAFSSNVKLEIIQKDTYRNRLSKLLMYTTTQTADPKEDMFDFDAKEKAADAKQTRKSLDEYVGNMKQGQKHIYYLVGSDLKELRTSPLLEGFVAKGYEVLLATDSIDEYCLQSLERYGEFELRNVAKEKALESTVSEETQARFKPLLEWLQQVLASEISEAVLSPRLTDSACAVSASEHGLTGAMEALMRSQVGASNDPMLRFMGMPKRIFELNPDSPVVASLLARVGSDAGRLMARTLYDAALIRSGYSVKNGRDFMKNIETLLLRDVVAVATEQAPTAKESGGAPEKPAGAGIEHDDL